MAIVAIGLICVVTVGVIVVLLPAPDFTDEFSWDVEVGDTFRFDISAWGDSYMGYVEYWQIAHLNDTSITVTVIDLPSFGAVHSAQTFASEIIFKNKVNCSFTNGTALDAWSNTTLCESISGCILPVGSWSTIDGLFPNETPGFTPNGEFLATNLYDDWLIIDYVWYGTFDAVGGWTGNISLSTGIPLSILWRYQHGVEPLYIELTLVE
jgi:hypothetical protein